MGKGLFLAYTQAQAAEARYGILRAEEMKKSEDINREKYSKWD